MQRILRAFSATLPNLTKRDEPIFTGLSIVKFICVKLHLDTNKPHLGTWRLNASSEGLSSPCHLICRILHESVATVSTERCRTNPSLSEAPLIPASRIRL